MSRYELANEAVTTCGSDELNTSLIMGAATLMRPMPPHATQKNVVARK